MPKHTNSASRLFGISEKISSARDDLQAVEMWAEIFNLPENRRSPVEICRRLIWLNEEIDGMVAQMGRTQFSEHLYQKAATGIRNAVSPTLLNSQARGPKGCCPPQIRTGLEFCADALPDEEESIDSEAIKALERLVADLRELVETASLPAYLAQMVQRHIDLLQRALEELPIKGIKALTEAAMAAAGQLEHLAKEVASDEPVEDIEKKRVVASGLLKTWKTVKSTVDVADKTGRLLAIAHEAYETLSSLF